MNPPFEGKVWAQEEPLLPSDDAMSYGPSGRIHTQVVEPNGPLNALGIQIGLACSTFVRQAPIDLNLRIKQPVVAGDVVGKHFRIVQLIHDGVATHHDNPISWLDFCIGHGNRLHPCACHECVIHLVGGLRTQKVKTVLIRMLRIEIALVLVCQLLKGHGLWIDQGVPQVQSLLIHEPRKFIHQTLVANGRQVDERGSVKCLKIPLSGIEVHMRGHIVGAKGDFIEVRALKQKCTFICIDGPFLHEEISGGQFRSLKVKHPFACHALSSQMHATHQANILSKELKRIHGG